MCVTEQFQQTKLILPLDVLVYVSPHRPVCNLPPLFIEGIVRQLHAMVHCIATHSQVLAIVSYVHIASLHTSKGSKVLLTFQRFFYCAMHICIAHLCCGNVSVCYTPVLCLNVLKISSNFFLSLIALPLWFSNTALLLRNSNSKGSLSLGWT